MSYHNLRSKLNRAVCAYLVSQNCGAVADVLPAESQAPRAYPNTTSKAGRGIPEPRNTGSYRVQLFISIKGTATVSVGEPDPQLAREQFDARVSATFDALMQGNAAGNLGATRIAINAAGRALAVAADSTPEAIQFAADNADMVDFTITQWLDDGFGDGTADDDGCSWEEVLIFSVLCCPSNVD